MKEALEVDWSSDKAKAALKRTTSDYFLLQGEGPREASGEPERLGL